MILLTRAGSFDEEGDDELRQEAVLWAVKAYGPTPMQRRRRCGCSPCREGQKVDEADVAAFFAHCDEVRTRLLEPPLLFNDDRRV